MAFKNSILLIEKDKDLNSYLTRHLVNEGFNVFSTSKETKSLKFINKYRPDLALLDCDLRSISGESVCKDIVERYPYLPVIILSSQFEAVDRIKGFEIGATDYIPKPVNVRELLIRIKVRLRDPGYSQTYTIRDIVMDDRQKRVERNSKRVPLTKKEYNLLKYLLINKNRVVSRSMIFNSVWGNNFTTKSRVVDVYVGYLRDKLHSQDLIRTVRGFGYLVSE